MLASPPKRGLQPPRLGAATGRGRRRAGVLAVLAVRWSRRRDGDDAPQQALSPDVERQIDDELARFDG